MSTYGLRGQKFEPVIKRSEIKDDETSREQLICNFEFLAHTIVISLSRDSDYFGNDYFRYDISSIPITNTHTSPPPPPPLPPQFLKQTRGKGRGNER